jgi:citrate lyase beta subunit
VAYNQKEEARHHIKHALETIDFGRSEKLVRINPVGSGLEQAELEVPTPSHTIAPFAMAPHRTSCIRLMR